MKWLTVCIFYCKSYTSFVYPYRNKYTYYTMFILLSILKNQVLVYESILSVTSSKSSEKVVYKLIGGVNTTTSLEYFDWPYTLKLIIYTVQIIFYSVLIFFISLSISQLYCCVVINVFPRSTQKVD